MKTTMNKINKIVIVMLSFVIAIGAAIPTFAATNKPSYYPYRSEAAKQHAIEMAFKNLEKNSNKKTTTTIKTTTKKSTTATKATTKVTTKPAAKIITKASNERHLNVSDAYTILNKFRTTRSNQWYWNANNKTKTYTYGLKSLKRDTTLENIAKIRAKEQWTRWYVQGKRDHTKPNGQSCWTSYTKNSRYCGECLHWWNDSTVKVFTDPNYGFAETNKKYKDQGHRRLMLDKKATRVGIACYEKNGDRCWAVCFGY